MGNLAICLSVFAGHGDAVSRNEEYKKTHEEITGKLPDEPTDVKDGTERRVVCADQIEVLAHAEEGCIAESAYKYGACREDVETRDQQ